MYNNQYLPPNPQGYDYSYQQPSYVVPATSAATAGSPKTEPLATASAVPVPTTLPQINVQPIPSLPQQYYNQQYQYHPKFTPQELQILKQLLVAGEKHKWKQITKEINQEAAKRRQSQNLSSAKNVAPTFVIKQYQALLGLPNNALYFGTVGSSLPYIMSNTGWDNLDDVE